LPIEPLVLFVIVITIIFILLLLILFKGNERLNRVLLGLGLKRRRFLLSKKVADKIDGTEFHWELIGDHLFVSFPFKSSLSFTIKRKKDLGLLEKHFGLTKTGQPDFDENFAIITNNESFVIGLFQRTEIRNLVQDLLNPWVDFIELNGKDLRICISMKTDSDPSLLKNHMPYLLKLKNTLQNELSPLKNMHIINRPFSIYLLYLIPICLGILEIIASIWMSHKTGKEFIPLLYSRLLLTALFLFIPLAFVYLFVAYKLIRPYPGAYSKFIIAACVLVIWCLMSLLFIQTSNGFFDKSEPKSEKYFVVDQVISRKKSYTLMLSKKPLKERQNFLNWVRNPINSSIVSLRVRKEEYFKVKPNESIVELRLRKGALGIEWIESYVLYNTSSDKQGHIFSKDCYSNGYALYRIGDLDGAIREYTKCLEDKGDNALLYYNRGVAYRKKGNYVEAYKDFEKAVTLKPDMIEAYKNIDWILTQSKDWEKIMGWWTKYIEHRPDDAEGYYERAGAYYHMGLVKQAVEDAKRACSLGKNEACQWVQKTKGG